jgi:hypothetical protein
MELYPKIFGLQFFSSNNSILAFDPRDKAILGYNLYLPKHFTIKLLLNSLCYTVKFVQYKRMHKIYLQNKKSK